MFPESQEAVCTGMARARTIASQSAENSRRRRNPFRNFMRLAGGLEKTVTPPHEFVSLLRLRLRRNRRQNSFDDGGVERVPICPSWPRG